MKKFAARRRPGIAFYWAFVFLFSLTAAGTARAETSRAGASAPTIRFLNDAPEKAGTKRANGQAEALMDFTRLAAGDNPLKNAQERAWNWLQSRAVSAGEDFLGSLFDQGRARLNFTLDWSGRFQGEGDVFWPLYDSPATTIFTQIGARSLAGGDSGDRWIGNFGLGQRWFPEGRNLMLGYNAFFDFDFTRSHSRGGLGLEAQWDWLRLATNFYFPLSGWKDSHDFDRRLVEERAARGWDARLKAYLPFYRHLALTGSHSQWSGDRVGVFGSSLDSLETNPKVWSYGLEWTPVPLFSGFLNQKRTERGQKETEAGLALTWHFGQSMEEQLSPAAVAGLRSVEGSRHEFVDRENKIILEYRAKPEAAGQAGCNNGFCVSFNRFNFVTLPANTPYQSTATVTASFLVAGAWVTPADGSVTWKITDIQFQNQALGGKPAWWLRAHNAAHGLEWGDDFTSATPETATVALNAAAGYTGATAKLTDIVGSRTITLEAQATIGGQPYTETVQVAFGPGPLSVFSSSIAPQAGIQWATLQGSALTPSGTVIDAGFNSSGATTPAAVHCGGTVNNTGITVTGSGPYTAVFPASGWRAGDIYTAEYFAVGSRLPTLPQLIAVSKYNGSYNANVLRRGAAFAANWPDDNNNGGYYRYWTGQVYFFDADGRFDADVVRLAVGIDYWDGTVTRDSPVTACAGF